MCIRCFLSWNLQYITTTLSNASSVFMRLSNFFKPLIYLLYLSFFDKQIKISRFFYFVCFPVVSCFYYYMCQWSNVLLCCSFFIVRMYINVLKSVLYLSACVFFFFFLFSLFRYVFFVSLLILFLILLFFMFYICTVCGVVFCCGLMFVCFSGLMVVWFCDFMVSEKH